MKVYKEEKEEEEGRKKGEEKKIACLDPKTKILCWVLMEGSFETTKKGTWVRSEQSVDAHTKNKKKERERKKIQPSICFIDSHTEWKKKPKSTLPLFYAVFEGKNPTNISC